ncbi:TRAP transporter large permease [Arhodomonas sp. SL1]|uniref:TRAP transporter large permease n=1 Tax=Arhodomonas sp. SL1 TaxID=3425691 RepID=UPI003F881EAB
MTPTAIGIVGFAAMLALMAVGMPVAFTMMLVGVVGVSLVLNPGAALHLLSSNLWEELSSYGLTVIPLFVLMGQLAYRSGVTRRLYRAAYTWFGRLPGGIAGTTVLTSSGFAAICGSNSATAATMGTIALPEMQRYGYDRGLSTGSVAIGGTLGAIIPPSVVLIVIAVQTEQSVIDLFLASFVPSALLVVLLLATISLLCWRRPALGPAGPATGIAEKLRSLTGVTEAVVLFALVVGGLYLGWFTPSEAGAAGAFGALAMGCCAGRLGWSDLSRAMVETLRISAMVVFLITGAVLFGRFLTITRLPFALAEWAAALPVPAVVILLVVLGIYAVGGALMDALGFLVVTLPIFFPLAQALGFDPVWFTVLLTLVTTMGAVTPPVGVNVYIVSGFAPDVPVQTIFRGVALFIIAYLVCIAAVIVYPDLVLALPRAAS